MKQTKENIRRRYDVVENAFLVSLIDPLIKGEFRL